MKNKTFWIAETAVMIALLVALQWATKALGQFVTGSCVNLVLGVSTLVGGVWCGAVVALVSPFCAFLVGVGPAKLAIVPFIAVGNLVLVLVLHFIAGGKPLGLRSYLAVAAAAVCKFVVLFLLVTRVAIPALNLPEAAASAMSASFSWPQLVTAAIGGVIAVTIAPAIRKALKRPDAVGLSECVGPYITAGFPDLLESFDTTLSMPGKTLQGHLPDMYGPAMSACIAAGVSTDHESFCEKDVFERLRNGCHLMMREGSAARNMPVLLKTVMENHLDTAMVSIVTDDLHTVDLQERGHLDDSLRTALGMGLDFVKAIQMVTVNCARAFNLDREIGGLAPGRRADVNITTGPEDFRVLTTFAGGRQITDNGKLLVHYETAEHETCVLNTMHLKNPITADSFKIHAPAGAKKVKALVMDTLPYMPFTNRRDVELPVVDGVVQCDVEQDVLYIAQVERHGKNGNVGKAFMGGFHIRGGAMASSVGHDNHNIIVMGDSFEDMALAVNRCVELGGGQVIVRSGKVAAEVAYPICGLLSDLPLEELAEKKKELNRVAHEMGTEIAIPFMFLSFICLAAIPAYAITDCGFIDVAQQKVIDPVLEVVE